MSSALLGDAFRADIKPHAFKLVMLKLVDAARDDGKKIFPSVETIAKAAGVSERHTKRVLKGFVDIGLLSIKSLGGSGPGSTTHYEMDIALLARLGTSCSLTFENGKGTIREKGDTESSLENKGDISDLRVTPETEKGDTSVTQPLKTPQIEPLEDLRENARRREKGKKPALSTRWRPLAPDLTEATKAFDGQIADAYEAHAQGGKGAMGNRERGIEALAALTPDDFADAVEAITRWLRAVKAAHKHALTVENYAKTGAWKLFPRPDGTAAAVMSVEPRSHEWCALFWSLVTAGTKAAVGRARAMHRDATEWNSSRQEYGFPYGVRKEELPTSEEMEALIKIPRDGEEFLAWRRHLGFRGPGLGLWIDGKAFGQWLWVPSRWPPQEQIGMRLQEGAAA